MHQRWIRQKSVMYAATFHCHVARRRASADIRTSQLQQPKDATESFIDTTVRTGRGPGWPLTWCPSRQATISAAFRRHCALARHRISTRHIHQNAEKDRRKLEELFANAPREEGLPKDGSATGNESAEQSGRTSTPISANVSRQPSQSGTWWHKFHWSDRPLPSPPPAASMHWSVKQRKTAAPETSTLLSTESIRKLFSAPWHRPAGR